MPRFIGSKFGDFVGIQTVSGFCDSGVYDYNGQIFLMKQVLGKDSLHLEGEKVHPEMDISIILFLMMELLQYQVLLTPQEWKY